SSAPNMESTFLRKQKFYCGRAKVRICSLRYEHEHLPGSRTLDVKNVERLHRIFQAQGCQRLDPDKHIAVMISDELLTAAIARSNITRADLFDIRNIPPHLNLRDDETLITLHGKHRVEAGRRFLDPADSWWIAELYSTQLPQEAVLELRTQFSNARGFSDGEVFRYLRHYQLLADETQVGKWEARLSKNKLNDVTNLELVHYLDLIYKMWSGILIREVNYSLLDMQTVQSLQLLYPQLSSIDRTRIAAGMASYELFPNIRDIQDRDMIKTNLLRVEGRILSLVTFFDDTKCLKPCAKILKKLLPAKEASLYHAFTSRFTQQQEGRAHVQVQEFEWHTYDGMMNQARAAAYLQLWLFAMRNFPYMNKQKPRKDSGKPDPQYELREEMWYELGQLAYKLGFRSKEIDKMIKNDPLEKIVRSFIFRMRPNDDYNTDNLESELQGEIVHLCRFLHGIPFRPSVPVCAEVNTDTEGADDSAYRSGRPFQSSYLAHRRYLFLQHIYKDYARVTTARYISAFGVARDIFVSFFG
ncbi:hypothetical protein M409DRAFT_33033, partial [Zasmidium cellare ATCC 36951]